MRTPVGRLPRMRAWSYRSVLLTSAPDSLRLHADKGGGATQRCDGFRILDLAIADHLEHLNQRLAAHGEHLVVVELLRAFRQTACEKEMDALIAEPGCG